jgi:putative aminopeptidase FrvX
MTTKLPANLDYCAKVLLELLATPSPTGFTEVALALVEKQLQALHVPFSRTPKGALLWTLKGETGSSRAVAAHIDTLGAMIKEIKKNGRLKLSMIGGYDWVTVEGAEVVVHTFDGREFTGTVVNIKQSTHVFGSDLRDLKRSTETMEVRLDVEVKTKADTQALGLEVGNFVSYKSHPVLTEHGFIKGRHLDNKAAVAIALAVTKTLQDARQQPASDVHFFISNYEEVGHGAAAGIPADITELLCIDMAAIGEGQTSDEYSVTLCVKDSSGPYDYSMNARLRRLARENGIDLKNDIYPYYSSDASAAWRAGGSYRAALIGPGVDASHAFERTHQKALEATSRLVLAYLLSKAE